MLASLEGLNLGVWISHGEGKFYLPHEKENYNINEIKKYHGNLDSKITKPKIIEQGKFGEDGYTISIGNVDKDARD